MSTLLRWAVADPPAYSQFATIDAATVRYQVAGPADGAPVMLVHGLSYPMEVWAALFDALVAAGYRVCRYDVWGRGLSALPHQPLTSAVLAQQLQAVAHVAQLKAPFAVVALSNADLIVTQLARVSPQLVRALVLLAPSGIDPRTMSFAARSLNALPLPARLAEARLRQRLLRRMHEHRLALPVDASLSIQHAYDFSMRSVAHSPAFAAAALSQLRHLAHPRQLHAHWAELGKRLLRVTAVRFVDERDTTGGGVQLMSRHFPTWRSVELAGTHMGLLEKPDAVAACVLAELATK